MYDSFNRNINYLRISVTDRCNLRCTYCMPAEGVPLMRHEDILSFDEIVEVVKVGVKLGIRKVRITGGEPLVRKNIVGLIRMLRAIPEIKDLSMTTNGILLPKFAVDLKEAGITRINISLDTMDETAYNKITRLGFLDELFAGIEAAKCVGFNPIKINCVIKESPNEPNAIAVKKYCTENNLIIRYIREMDLEEGLFWQVNGGDGGDCINCNRLRLTSNGKIKPCLFNNLEYDVRKMGAENAFLAAVKNKPACGTANNINHFNNIGG